MNFNEPLNLTAAIDASVSIARNQPSDTVAEYYNKWMKIRKYWCECEGPPNEYWARIWAGSRYRNPPKREDFRMIYRVDLPLLFSCKQHIDEFVSDTSAIVLGEVEYEHIIRIKWQDNATMAVCVIQDFGMYYRLSYESLVSAFGYEGAKEVRGNIDLGHFELADLLVETYELSIDLTK